LNLACAESTRAARYTCGPKFGGACRAGRAASSSSRAAFCPKLSLRRTRPQQPARSGPSEQRRSTRAPQTVCGSCSGLQPKGANKFQSPPQSHDFLHCSLCVGQGGPACHFAARSLRNTGPKLPSRSPTRRSGLWTVSAGPPSVSLSVFQSGRWEQQGRQRLAAGPLCWPNARERKLQPVPIGSRLLGNGSPVGGWLKMGKEWEKRRSGTKAAILDLDLATGEWPSPKRQRGKSEARNVCVSANFHGFNVSHSRV